MSSLEFKISWVCQLFILFWLAFITFAVGRIYEMVDVMKHNIGIATEQPSCEPIGPRIDEDRTKGDYVMSVIMCLVNEIQIKATALFPQGATHDRSAKGT